MKICINQFFTEPGSSYPFTGILVGWVECQIMKRARLSKAFAHRYSNEYGLCIFLDARRHLSQPEIHGPKKYARGKEVQFTIILPHLGGPESNEPADNVQVMKLLFESLAVALQKVEINPSKILEDMPAITQEFLTKPNMIRASQNV